MRRFVGTAALSVVLAVGALPVVIAGAQTGPTGYTFVADFVGQPTCSFLAVDLPTGEATTIGEDRVCADGLAFAPDGTLYGFTGAFFQGAPLSELVTIDLSTGISTPVGELPDLFGGGMAFDAAGALWLYGFSALDAECEATGANYCLYQVDPSTAATTFVGGLPPEELLLSGLTATCEEVQGLVAAPVTGTPALSLDRVDTSDASVTSIVETPDASPAAGLDYSADGRLWAIGVDLANGTPPVVVHEIDVTTGAVTTTPVTLEGQQIEALPVGLGVAPLSCEVPPPAPEPVVLQPAFTG